MGSRHQQQVSVAKARAEALPQIVAVLPLRWSNWWRGASMAERCGRCACGGQLSPLRLSRHCSQTCRQLMAARQACHHC